MCLLGMPTHHSSSFLRHNSNMFSEDKWHEVVLSLKEVANSTLPDFSFALSEDSEVWNHEEDGNRRINGEFAGANAQDDDIEDKRRHRLYAAISDAQCRAAVQLLLIQAVMEIYTMYRSEISVKNITILFDTMMLLHFMLTT